MPPLPFRGRHPGAQACLHCYCTPAGWPLPAPKASLVLGKVSETRKNVLRDRALLAIRLPSAPFDQHGQFRWLLQADPNDQRLHDATWYCDGSMLNGRWKAIRATGFGIAVVSMLGVLLAYGLGCPPSWCATAAAAEAWAVQVPCAHSRRRYALTAWPSSPQRSRGPRQPRIIPDHWPESGVT